MDFFEVFQLWANFDGNLSHWWLLLNILYDRRAFLGAPRENRMSGKNLDQPWDFLPWDRYTRSGCFEWSIQLLAVFSCLVDQINLILHILIILNGLNNLAMVSLMLDHSKITKMHFWMIQRAKKDVLGHFLQFGLLDWLDIAYGDSTKCFPTFGNITRSRRIVQKAQYCIFEWSQEPKKRFLAIFWSLVCWIDLILHMVIVLNDFQHLAMLPGQEESLKSHKNAVLNDPKSQKRGFWPFSWVWSVGWTWYYILWSSLKRISLGQV